MRDCMTVIKALADENWVRKVAVLPAPRVAVRPVHQKAIEVT